MPTYSVSHGEKESVRSVSQKAGPKWKLPLTWASAEAIFRTQKAGNAKSSLLMLQVVAKGLETTAEKLLKGLYHRLGNATKVSFCCVSVGLGTYSSAVNPGR